MYNTFLRKKQNPLDLIFNVMNTFDEINTSYPKINLLEDEEKYTIEVFYPGIEKKDFKISVENDFLEISSTFSDESKKEEKYHLKEFYKKSFSRSFSLPNEINKEEIKANCDNGILKITLPKDKEKEKKNKFDIKID